MSTKEFTPPSAAETAALRLISDRMLDSPAFLSQLIQECETSGQKAISEEDLNRFVEAMRGAQNPAEHALWSADVARQCIRHMAIQILMLQADLKDSEKRM